MARLSGKIAFGALALATAAIPAASALASAESAPEALTEEQVTKGRELFTSNSCNQCHTLADASAQGSVGPSLDGAAHLDKAVAVDKITNGSGPMPSFGWLEPADIDLLAAYIVQVKK